MLGFEEDSVTLALFSSDAVDITVGLGRDLSKDLDAACRTAVRQASSATGKDPVLCFILPDTANIDQSDIAGRLGELLGSEALVIGGGSSAADPQDWKSFQFFGRELLQDSLPILLFSGPLACSAGVATGWNPLGKAGVVTRAQASVVHEIDSEPALEFFKRYVGSPSPALIGTPLAVFESNARDYYLRAPLEYDVKSGAVTFFGPVPEGSRVQISHTSTDDMLEAATRSFESARTLYPASKAPEAALLVSCAVRKMLLGARTKDEMSQFDRLNESSLPVCGFYAYGEIGPLDDGKSHFLNQTIVTLLFGT
jgi:hypothetical protein